MTSAGEQATFAGMLTLDERGPDSFAGTGPQYPWGGLFGGQIVAQSLAAAARTVDPSFRVHSLHAYFIRPGDAAEPIRFDVDRLRDGRSFCTRAVVTRQTGGPIFHMSASFNRSPDSRRAPDAGLDIEAPPPEAVAESGWSPLLRRRVIVDEAGRAVAWLRIPEAAEPGPVPGWVAAAAALAYLSDDLPADCVRSALHDSGAPVGGMYGISLDHAMWFHAVPQAGDWQLHDLRCDGLQPPRGLARGRILSPKGVHLATVSQEVLLRQGS